ncbi:MAG: hypothetical protein GY865_09735 [candidate division Zixibacteria bacterium]|nr:hypothetical protein [candidate division Zixibacteria bacterium]
MRKSNNRYRIRFLASVLFISLIFSVAKGAENKIVFLHFLMDSNTISLISSTPVDGKLKKPRFNTTTKEVYFEVITADSKLLSSGNIYNPLIKRLEYENPNKPGELLNKTINLESAEFTIRVNYSELIDHINFYRTTYDEDPDSIKRSNKLISSVSLTSIVGGENE